MARTLIGIDPGVNGAIAIQNVAGAIEILKLADATDRDVSHFLLFRTPGVAALERVASSPQQGVVSAFTFGASFGALRMALACHGLETHLVRPQKWRGAMQVRKVRGGLGRNDAEKKRATRERAQQVYPDLRVTNATADALLLLAFVEKFYPKG